MMYNGICFRNVGPQAAVLGVGRRGEGDALFWGCGAGVAGLRGSGRAAIVHERGVSPRLVGEGSPGKNVILPGASLHIRCGEGERME